MKRYLHSLLRGGALTCLSTTALFAAVVTNTVQNPEGTLAFRLYLDAGALSYDVVRTESGKPSATALERSPLGLRLADADLTGGFASMTESAVRPVVEKYELTAGKRRSVETHFNEQTFTLRHQGGQDLSIVVRAARDGVAFRYALAAPEKGKRRELVGEATGFKLPRDGKAWLQPYDKPGLWLPAYEAEYRSGIPIGTAGADEFAGWCFPGLFHVQDQWVLITEAGIDGTSYASHLEPNADGGLYRIRLPEKGENGGLYPQSATLAGPWTSPWRLAIVGSGLATIVESTLVTDLSAPSELKNTAWIKPGRVSWSWWSDAGSPRDYNRLVPFVDLAADFGWEYSLIDANWQEMVHGDIEQLLGYAKKRNVGLLLWYNSGGPTNQVTEAPRDRLFDPEKRRAEFAKIEGWGVKGVKVDFFQGDTQGLMQLYIDILRDAAKHHLLVDFHGCTLPRGWSRTFPNLMSMEGVRGAEQYWDPNFAEHAASLHTIYTFTRNVVGSMDYTPVVFSGPAGRYQHQTSYAHELATGVAFESGLQHFADAVAAYRQLPDEVQAFLKQVPVVWDETRYVAGEPGDLSVLARRHGTTWYVSALNGRSSPREISVPLTFLPAGRFAGQLIADGDTAITFAVRAVKASVDETITVPALSRGGFVLKLEPAKP